MSLLADGLVSKALPNVAAIVLAASGIGTLSAEAQSTCAAADSTARNLRGELIQYTTATTNPYKAVRDSVRLPALTTAQVATQIVQTTSGTLCSQASIALNKRAIRRDPSDNVPTRTVYLFKVGTRYVVAGDFKGAPSDVSVYASDLTTRLGGYFGPD